MDDKIKLLEKLSCKVDHIFIAGGNVNNILKANMKSYLQKISENKAKISMMNDGLCAPTLKEPPSYAINDQLKDKELF